MSAATWIKGFWNHPAGPKTIHFWVSGTAEESQYLESALVPCTPIPKTAWCAPEPLPSDKVHAMLHRCAGTDL
jgi:hypothetical protein